MLGAVGVLYLPIAAVVSGQPEGHFNEIDLAEDMTTGILDRADDIGVFGRHERVQSFHAKRRANTTRCVAVLHSDRNSEERGTGTCSARLVRIPGRCQHGGFIYGDERIQVRIISRAP